MTGNVVAGAVLVGIVMGILVQVSIDSATPVYAVNEIVEEEEVIEIEVVIDWTKERIEKEIRATFPEDPETAIAIFKCESGLRPDAKGPTSDYGVAQIHQPSWDKVAKRLGHEDYQTDVRDNLAMARHIYDNAGKKWTDWVCYTRKMI